MVNDTSPPAFPSGSATHDIPGMSLRDWFAGQALTGVITLSKNDTAALKDRAVYIAEACYQIADAMLAERAKS